MVSAAVVPAGQFRFRPERWLSAGLEVAVMGGAQEGLVHIEAALSRLAPGAGVTGHRHFFEESFMILSGEVLVNIGGRRFHLRQGDFGFVPAAVPHAWRNPGSEPVEWFRLRSPQPRRIDNGMGTFLADEVRIPTAGDPVGDPDPTVPYVGHFAEHHLPPPGPVSLRGYRGPNISSVSLWMLVDDYIGAVHHNLFIVQFTPKATTRPKGDHFHPFEETYYFLQGSAVAHLESGDLAVNTGDFVYSPTNAMHGFTMTSDEPVRWIEVQAPAPTASGAVVFPSDWQRFDT
jgi:mannose-6-phosphate isomerase-like protein (cupin superfamily)